MESVKNNQTAQPAVVRGEATVVQVSPRGQIRLYTVESEGRQPSLELRYFRLGEGNEYSQTSRAISIPLSFNAIDGLQSAISGFKLLVDEPSDAQAVQNAPVPTKPDVTAGEVFQALKSDLVKVISTRLIDSDRSALDADLKRILSILVDSGGWTLLAKSSFYGSTEFGYTRPLIQAMNQWIAQGRSDAISKVFLQASTLFESEISELVAAHETATASEAAKAAAAVEAAEKFKARIASCTVLELLTLLVADNSARARRISGITADGKVAAKEVADIVQELLKRPDLRTLFKRDTFSAMPEVFDTYRNLLKFFRANEGAELTQELLVSFINIWKEVIPEVAEVETSEVVETPEVEVEVDPFEGMNYDSYAVGRDGVPFTRSQLTTAEAAYATAHELGQYLYGLSFSENGRVKRTKLFEVCADSGVWIPVQN